MLVFCILNIVLIYMWLDICGKHTECTEAYLVSFLIMIPIISKRSIAT